MGREPAPNNLCLTEGAATWPAWRKAFSFPVLLGALLVAGAFASTSGSGGVVGSRIFADDDLWWHLTVGQRILATGTWPTSDLYSFTVPGAPWVSSQWFGEVVMALAARMAGWQGLVGLLVGLAAALILLVYYYAYLRCGNSKAAFLACPLMLPMVAPFLTGRPNVLGYVFLLIVLISLERFRQGRPKLLWTLPGVFLLWVNTHGTFVLGLMALGVYWVSGLVRFRHRWLVSESWTAAQRRQLALVSLLCTLVLPLTPYASRLAAYPLEMTLFQRITVSTNGEWRPLWANNGPWGYVFLGLLLFFVLAQAFSGPLVYRLEEVLLCLFAVCESLLHIRFLFLFAIVFAPLLAVLLGRWVPVYHLERDKPVLNAVLMGLIVAGLAAAYPSNPALRKVAEREYPKGAVDFLRSHPEIGRTFNEDWGGYLIWSGRKVFFDGRRDFYEYAGVFSDYISIVNRDPATQFLLRKYGVKSCLLKRGAPLDTFLRTLPDWEQVYSDELSSFYVLRSRAGKFTAGTNPLPAPARP